jgi:hypothetical protein
MGDAERAECKSARQAKEGSMKKLSLKFKWTRARAGRLGGFARAAAMTKKERRASALKASRAAAKARTRAAKARRS